MTKSAARIIILSNKNMRHMDRFGQSNCQVCKKELVMGDEVVTKKGLHTKWYHKKCAEKFNII